jgi:hypothetical protein
MPLPLVCDGQLDTGDSPSPDLFHFFKLPGEFAGGNGAKTPAAFKPVKTLKGQNYE